MKIGDRFLSLLNGIVLIMIGFILVMVIWRSDVIVDKLNAFTDKERFWVLAVSVVSLVLAFLSLGMAFQRRREEKTIIHQTQIGEIQIAVSAVESLALRATKRIKGVKDAHVGVRADSTGLDVFIEVTVNPDLSIPQISEEIRVKADEYLQETVGIHVNSVKVLVTKVAGEAVKARVE
ncbi:MAG TPA: alkaline shock response membrane anchor protein AmaP [Bacillota bacterium]|nr:alkaline shock response membrane anchor protein AmaP [Bacillota bacterium]